MIRQSVGDVENIGNAYRVRPGTSDRKLTEVGFGTPMGELLRRYWHPIGLTDDAASTPRIVKVLGEELILFRNAAGTPGLLYPRCAHRGTSLYYGKVEAAGIRCCYHGWLFDPQGNCLDQPCEPGGGRARGHVRQPWYPLEERYGLIWAYLGPPERKPLLPRFEAFENLASGEMVDADDLSIGTGGGIIEPCNWFQHFENLVDPYHVVVLHNSFSGPQFVKALESLPDELHFERMPLGVKVTSLRRRPDGSVFRRISAAALPTLRVIPSPAVARFERVDAIGFILPLDDTHMRIYTISRVREKGEYVKTLSTMLAKNMKNMMKPWTEMTAAERRAAPGDWEAQVGQGPITLHSEEHLASTDRGISMLRRFVREQLDIVENGGDPAGVAFDEQSALLTFDAGNFLDAAAVAPA